MFFNANMNKGCFWPNLRRAILAWNLMEAIEGQGGHQEVPLSKIFPPFFAAPAFFACQGRGRHLFESLVSLRYVSPLSLLAFQQSLKNASDILIEIRTLHHSNNGFLDFGWITAAEGLPSLLLFPSFATKGFLNSGGWRHSAGSQCALLCTVKTLRRHPIINHCFHGNVNVIKLLRGLIGPMSTNGTFGPNPSVCHQPHTAVQLSIGASANRSCLR